MLVNAKTYAPTVNIRGCDLNIFYGYLRCIAKMSIVCCF